MSSYWDDLANDTSPPPATAAASPSAAPKAEPAKTDGYWDSLAQEAAPQHQPSAEDVPAWSDIPMEAVYNSPGSLAQFGENIYHAGEQIVRHPINTAGNLTGIGLGYLEKAGRYAGLPAPRPDGEGFEKYADAVNQMVYDRYGTVDNLKKTLAHDPVGVLGDASAALSGGPGLVGKIGRAVDPINIGAKIAKGATTATRETLGLTTGVGPEAISRAAEAGFNKPVFSDTEAAQSVRENMRGKVPVEGVVDDAMGAIENIVSNKNADYQTGIAQAGLNKPISQSSMQKIHDGITNANKLGNLQGYQYSQGALKANSDLRAIVDKFFDPSNAHVHTVEGLDALKQEIGEYQRTNNLTGKASIVGNEYYHAVKNAIVDQAPGYAKVMDAYSEAKDTLSQLQKSFSLPTQDAKLNVDAALKKLQSIMRNNVNTNYGYRQTLAQHLRDNGAPNIDYALAGQALNSGSPRGLSRVGHVVGAEVATALGTLIAGHPVLAAAAATMAGLTAIARSPRLVGEASYYAGRAAHPLKYVRPAQPALRAAQQAGRFDLDKENAINIRPIDEGQSRGGAIGRAKRLAMRKH